MWERTEMRADKDRAVVELNWMNQQNLGCAVRTFGLDRRGPAETAAL